MADEYKKKIATFGGSFNPFHLGHIRVINRILSEGIIDEVWVIPCKIHALDKKLENEEDRIRMIELSLENKERVRISRVELESEGKNYTRDTMRALRKKFPYEFYPIFGSDILETFDKWIGRKELFNESQFIILKRPEYDITPVKGMNVYRVIESPVGNISSTEIRERISRGESIEGLVSRKVEDYIKQRGLYNG